MNMQSAMLGAAAITAMEQGGATLDLTTLEPVDFTGGYIVGGAVPSSAGSELTVSAIVQHVQSFLARADVQARILAQSNLYLGLWISGADENYRSDDSKCIVDLSEHVRDIDTALELMYERGEDAVWDVDMQINRSELDG